MLHAVLVNPKSLERYRTFVGDAVIDEALDRVGACSRTLMWRGRSRRMAAAWRSSF